ncbi:hypothetical protein [Streptomyces globisporus]|uniref:hypothetical protein n=1 Tax=Streptomyces globisporus TaxID=1908 RepID=UPI000AEBD16B|nr:hypothetical protein [Streptomyces globisporus]
MERRPAAPRRARPPGRRRTGLVHGAPPSTEAAQPPPARTEALPRLVTAGAGRVLRRSRDLLPQLLLLAGAELCRSADGTGTASLDALTAALAATMGR